jgi:hypothetical protein
VRDLYSHHHFPTHKLPSFYLIPALQYQWQRVVMSRTKWQFIEVSFQMVHCQQWSEVNGTLTGAEGRENSLFFCDSFWESKKEVSSSYSTSAPQADSHEHLQWVVLQILA